MSPAACIKQSGEECSLMLSALRNDPLKLLHILITVPTSVGLMAGGLQSAKLMYISGARAKSHCTHQPEPLYGH